MEFFKFILPFLDQVPVVRAILGFVLVFFLPGFGWTLVFFKQINVVERIALSFGLSVALVTVSILIANRAGVKITGANSVIVIIVLVILPLAIYCINWFARKNKNV
ncbi:MAG: DUF1616 domain-containing protein [Chloroflexota bacterium]